MCFETKMTIFSFDVESHRVILDNNITDRR